MQEYTNIADIIIHLHYCFHSTIARDDAFIKIDDIYVQSGQLNDYNEIYCIEHNLKQISLNRPGGTLVFFPGDFAYGHFGNDAQEFTLKWRDYLVSKLKDRGLNAQVSNNDILVDNNKVTGTVVMHNKMALGLISINPDADLIRKVCTKPSDDNFEGLIKYGIDANQIADWYKDFIRNY